MSLVRVLSIVVRVPYIALSGIGGLTDCFQSASKPAEGMREIFISALSCTIITTTSFVMNVINFQ